MRPAEPQIVAFGGGGFSMEAGNPLLDEYVLSLTRRERPRVCFVPTASGDADHYVVRFYRAFSPAVCEPSHLSLFRRDRGAGAVEGDLAEHLLSQDLIYVGGGSVISLLGAWRAHGIDEILREAWLSGVVLCGLSAGSLCWFAEAVTAFHGRPQRVDGLGSCRSPTASTTTASRSGAWSTTASSATGCAADTPPTTARRSTSRGPNCGDVVTSRRGRRAYRVDVEGHDVIETPLEARYLGLDEPALSAA